MAGGERRGDILGVFDAEDVVDDRHRDHLLRRPVALPGPLRPGPEHEPHFKLPSTCSSPHDITAAGDGSVWLSCNSAKAIRVTDSGAMRTVGLSHVATLGSFAAGASGSMWAIGYNSSHSPIGLVRITSGGGEAYYGTPRASPRGAWRATARAG